MFNNKLIVLIFLVIVLLYFGVQSGIQQNTESFKNGDKGNKGGEGGNGNKQTNKEQDRNGLLTISPNPNTEASPSANAQTAQANSVYLASSPGTMPGGAELTQGSTAFLTNTPSRYVQQFATDTIVTNSQANAAYRTILNYLSQNPTNSFMFLKDIRSKFFKDDAKYKEDINFRELAASDNMIFN
jgi:hypothetical protein